MEYKFSTKKNILKTSFKYNKELFFLPGLILYVIFTYFIGWGLNLFSKGFVKIEDVDVKNQMVARITAYFCSGCLFELVTVLLLAGFCVFSYAIIIYPILKQAAIVRYCKLPLTEEEIRIGMEQGLFSDMPSYLRYLQEEMEYGILCENLYFKNKEIQNIISLGWKVFNCKDDDYFELPDCISDYFTMECETLYCITGFECDAFCVRNDKVNNLPKIETDYGVYGKTYKNKIDNFITEYNTKVENKKE